MFNPVSNSCAQAIRAASRRSRKIITPTCFSTRNFSATAYQLQHNELTNLEETHAPSISHHELTRQAAEGGKAASSSLGTRYPVSRQKHQAQRRSETLSLRNVTVNINGQDEPFNVVFLRDCCRCPRCVDPSTQQKLFQTSDIPLNIQARQDPHPVEAQILRFRWTNDISGFDEDHVTEIPFEFLRESLALGRRLQRSREPPADRVLWNRERMQDDNLWVDYQQYKSSDAVLLDALRQLRSHGLVFLRNVPDDESSVVSIAERIGPMRDSFYGRTWNVKSVPDAKNIAYTHQYLGLHMDLLYMTNPPHLQFLHSLRAQAPGGESLFSDSIYAAEIIREEDPKAFLNLAAFPISYHYHNAAQHYQTTRTTIELDCASIAGGHGGHQINPSSFLNRQAAPSEARMPHITSAIQRINWSPPFQAPYKHHVGVLDDTFQIQGYLAAAKRFSDLVNAEENVFELRLAEGECVIFDNRRVLHARKAFDISAGERWLKGAYVDDDVFYSRLRVLEENAKKDT